MAVQNFVLLGRRDRERLQERFAAVIERWRQEWCYAPIEAEIDIDDCLTLDAGSNMHWQTASSDKEALVSLGVPQAASFIADLVGSADAEGRGATAQSLIDTAVRTLGAAVYEASADGKARALHWSSAPPELSDANGFVGIRCRLGGGQITVVLHPALTLASLRAPTALSRAGETLTPVRTAVARERVVLRVCAGESELALPELATLAVGDVIKLDRSLDQPALVAFGNGPTVCAGHLGTQGNNRAVQLVALPDRKDT